MPGPHVPLSTLRRRPRERLRMTQGRCGSLLHIRMTLSFTTPRRFNRRTRKTHIPLCEITQSRHICASVRLDEVTAAQVDQYAAFIQASADDVVDKALNYVFSKDRDFQDFLKMPQAKQVAPALRVRKGPSNG